MSKAVGIKLHHSELGDLADSFGTALKVPDDVEPEPESSTTSTDLEDGSTAMTSPVSHAAEEGEVKVPKIHLTSDTDSEKGEEEGGEARGGGGYERELDLLLFFRPDMPNGDSGNQDTDIEHQYWSLDVLQSRLQLTDDCHKSLFFDELTRHSTKKDAMTAWAKSAEEDNQWLNGIMDNLNDAVEDWQADTGLSFTHLTHDETVEAVESFRNSDSLDCFTEALARQARSCLKTFHTAYLPTAERVESTLADESDSVMHTLSRSQ
jgi:hypothetical protein